MSKFIMPSMKPQTRGRKSQTFHIKDLEGNVFQVNSLRRFSELINRPLKSLYSLTAGRSATLSGLTMWPEDAEVPENVIVVNSDTVME